MAMGVHGGGLGNVNSPRPMAIPGEFIERCLLHPFADYEQPRAYLNSIFDPMDEEGYVRVPEARGMGLDISFHHIQDNPARRARFTTHAARQRVGITR